MNFKARPILTSLALALATTAALAQSPHPILPPDQVEKARALQPQRAAQALAFLKAQSLGLGADDSYRELLVSTNSQGQTIVRYEQLHQGYRVFGTYLTVRIDPDGVAHLLAREVASEATVDAAIKLTQEDAILAAHRHLAPSGEYMIAPKAERVLFPTVLTEGIKLITNKDGESFVDREASLVGPAPSVPFTWAYVVQANFNNPVDGFHEYNLVVDAGTGQVLKKWDAGQGFIKQAPRSVQAETYASRARLANSRPVVAASSRMDLVKATAAQTASIQAMGGLIPAKGWGLDSYVHNLVPGQPNLIPVDTAQSPLGTGYDLVDLTRTTRPHPIFQTVGNQVWYGDWGPYFGLKPALSDIEFPYLSEYFGSYSMDNLAWSADGQTGAGSTTNIWGDGKNYLSPLKIKNYSITHAPTSIQEFHYGDANAQTAAVGAHYATSVTYDMYKNVFGHLGVDGKNSGMLTVVHDNAGGIMNAHWSNVDMMMHYGDGDWSEAEGGMFKNFATLAIGGHEISHGVMANLANVAYSGESMGLNEANSDILGVSAEAYSRRDPGAPLNRIPEGKIDWRLATEISPEGHPLRWMDKPSLDGYSFDAWFQGVGLIDGHYTSGIPNRFFYFLCMGSSSDTSSNGYSPYLPEGMKGIGQDAAARIWFKAMSEHMTHTTTIYRMRAPLMEAAADLYGEGSLEQQAVANALAAVNIGAPWGSQGRPLVTLKNNRVDPYSPLGNVFLPLMNAANYLYYTTPWVPMGESMKLEVNVTNTDNPAVTWKTGWNMPWFGFPADGIHGTGAAGSNAANGRIEADGTYYASPSAGPKFCMTTATSVADPLEFVYQPVGTAMCDTDGDGQTDALDMAAWALCYNTPRNFYYTVNPGGYPFGYIAWNGGSQVIAFSFDDFSLQVWNQAFMNAFAQ